MKTENEAEETDTGTPGKSLQEGRREVRYLGTQALLDEWTGPWGRRASFRPGGLLSSASRQASEVVLLSVCFSLPNSEPRRLAGARSALGQEERDRLPGSQESLCCPRRGHAPQGRRWTTLLLQVSQACTPPGDLCQHRVELKVPARAPSPAVYPLVPYDGVA